MHQKQKNWKHCLFIYLLYTDTIDSELNLPLITKLSVLVIV